MRKIKLVIAVLLFGFFVICGSKGIQHRIVGGQQTDISELPYQLSIGLIISETEGKFLCGGALISDLFGLSAAHCFVQDGTYYARAGSDKLNTGGEIVKLRYVLVHPNYSSLKQEDCDIAVLKFFELLKLTNNIKPIQMADSDDKFTPGLLGKVSGWGQTSSFVPDISTKLKSVKLPVTDQENCRMLYRTVLPITHRQFCAGFLSGGKDSCQGDSGGPFAINNKLYGLVSFGVSCGQPGIPGVYVSIPGHREYIRANTGL